MKEKPILFSAPMVRAILDGRKTQTRRVMKDTLIYSLTDDRIYGKFNKEVYHEQGSCFKENTDFPERRLYGWVGWSGLFTNEIQRLWSQGVRGLVSVKRSHKKGQGVSNNFNESQQQKGDNECSQVDLHGISRDTADQIIAGSTFGWRPWKQHSNEFGMGNTTRELDGQKITWPWQRGGETSNGKIIRQRMPALTVGNQDWVVQPKACGKGSWNVAGWNISHSEWQKVLALWVRETWAAGKCADAFSPSMLDVKTWKADNGGLWYSADDCKPITPISPKGKNRPSIHMPRWASRIDLIIKDIRVELLQDISEEDAIFEGIKEAPCLCGDSKCDAVFGSAVEAFQSLWDSINGKPHKTLGDISWEANPYCWVVDFERIKP